jgi:uncharacterized membrane protein
MQKPTGKALADNTTFGKMKHHIRRKMLIGIVVFTPFAVTIWILMIVLGFIAGVVADPVALLASQLGWKKHIQYLAMTVAVVFMILMIYAIGLFSATFLGRRFISVLENLLRRIPGGEFLYSTIKQIIELVSLTRAAGTGQRVVMIEFPRKGVYSVAFFSGITIMPGANEPMVNVFYATTPNPTTGFLMLLHPSEVWETDLTLAEASRFIMSGGVVRLPDLKMRPFPIQNYLGKMRALETAGVEKIVSAEPAAEKTGPKAAQNASASPAPHANRK